MRESFLTPDNFLKKQAREEIEEGISEYLANPKSKEGMHAELAETFEVEMAEQPLTLSNSKKR